MPELYLFPNDSFEDAVVPQVVENVSRRQIAESQKAWSDYKAKHRPAEVPDNDHWDWEAKRLTSHMPLLRGLAYEGEMQALMLLSDAAVKSRIAGSNDLSVAYIAYLEVAPWNQRTYAGETYRFQGAGTAMLSVAIDLSERRGCGGRLALHSTPAAEGFYLSQGLVLIGYDEEAGLNYFELGEPEQGEER